MYFSIIAALIAASSAIDPARAALAARDSSASADVGVAAAPEGWVDIDLVSLASNGLQKRKAMTYCANQDSGPGESSHLLCNAFILMT